MSLEYLSKAVLAEIPITVFEVTNLEVANLENRKGYIGSIRERWIDGGRKDKVSCYIRRHPKHPTDYLVSGNDYSGIGERQDDEWYLTSFTIDAVFPDGVTTSIVESFKVKISDHIVQETFKEMRTTISLL